MHFGIKLLGYYKFCLLSTLTQLLSRLCSRARYATPCAGCTIERDYDYGGSDLETHSNVESAENCAVLCGSTSGCMSWTYGKKQGQDYTNKCFLKSSVQPNRQVADCGDSGIPCNSAEVFHFCWFADPVLFSKGSRRALALIVTF